MNPNRQQLLARIAELERKLAYQEAVYNTIPNIVFTSEAWLEDGEYCVRCVSANESAWELTGYKPEDVFAMGKDFGKIVFHPDDYELGRKSFEYHMKPENSIKPFGGYFKFKLANGEYAWALGHSKKLNYDCGNQCQQFVISVFPVYGHMQTDAHVQRLIAEERSKGNESRISKITKTEMMVLKEVAKGKSNEDAGLSLKMKPNTVRKHKENFMRKLELHSTPAIIHFAYEYGLISENL